MPSLFVGLVFMSNLVIFRMLNEVAKFVGRPSQTIGYLPPALLVLPLHRIVEVERL